MLPADRRVRRGDEFARVIRGGRRAGRPTLVVHLGTPEAVPAVSNAPQARTGQPRAGFVVSKAVGVAVVRNRVKRRLRHLVAERLDSLPADTVLVVRALPASAGAPAADLARDLDLALARLTVPAERAGTPRMTRRR